MLVELLPTAETLVAMRTHMPTVFLSNHVTWWEACVVWVVLTLLGSIVSIWTDMCFHAQVIVAVLETVLPRRWLMFLLVP